LFSGLIGAALVRQRESRLPVGEVPLKKAAAAKEGFLAEPVKAR